MIYFVIVIIGLLFLVRLAYKNIDYDLGWTLITILYASLFLGVIPLMFPGKESPAVGWDYEYACTEAACILHDNTTAYITYSPSLMKRLRTEKISYIEERTTYNLYGGTLYTSKYYKDTELSSIHKSLPK